MLTAFRSVPLRVKLVAAVLVLVATALVVISVGSVYFLRTYLVARIDDELTSYLSQIQGSIPAFRSDGLPSDYVVAAADPALPSVDVYCDQQFGKADLPGMIDSEAWYESQAGGGPFTAMSGSKGLRWRVVIAKIGPENYVAVAQSLSNVDYAVGRLARIDVAAGGAVLLLLAAAGAGIVRYSLRPLNEIERTAAASETRARRSEERMRRFIADASHELRTPLTTIRGFAELYRQGAVTPTDRQSHFVRRIEDEATRMGLLVEDLLFLARLDEEQPFALAPVDLRVLVADTVHAARVAAPDRDIHLSVAPGPGPLVVEGDDQRLRQMLDHLVGNALNHTPSTAAVALVLRSEEDTAIIEVRDTGPGLAPEEAERVFEQFYRADPARARPAGSTSTGLGLAIVAALVSVHAGSVEVESESGNGSTFRVRLPLRRA